MRIKFWGARGSIPVSGKNYNKYGGSTTCVEVRSKKDELVIVDAGSGIRLLGKELLKNSHNRFHMLFTHSHWDHVLGFPFFAPIYNKKTQIRIMGCSFSSDPVREIIAKTMQPPGFPVKFEEISARFEFASVCASGCDVEGMQVLPIELSHPNNGLGYKFCEGGRTFAFLTDNELGYAHPGGRPLEDYVAFARGADLLVHDADYLPAEYPDLGPFHLGTGAGPGPQSRGLLAGAFPPQPGPLRPGRGPRRGRVLAPRQAPRFQT